MAKSTPPFKRQTSESPPLKRQLSEPLTALKRQNSGEKSSASVVHRSSENNENVGATAVVVGAVLNSLTKELDEQSKIRNRQFGIILRNAGDEFEGQFSPTNGNRNPNQRNNGPTPLFNATETCRQQAQLFHFDDNYR